MHWYISRGCDQTSQFIGEEWWHYTASIDTATTDWPVIAQQYNLHLKAAALSFQTWALRYHGLVGIILGSKDKNRITASSIVVDYSFSKLMNDEKMKLVNESHNLFICGIAMFGHLTDDSQVRDQLLSDIVASGQQYATCLLAPYLNYFIVFFEYICKYIYIYTCKLTYIYIYNIYVCISQYIYSVFHWKYDRQWHIDMRKTTTIYTHIELIILPIMFLETGKTNNGGVYCTSSMRRMVAF